MSLSTGSPGSIFLRMPSMAAMVIAANARYGLQLESGLRNSSRRVLGFVLYMGMRMAAERFWLEYTRFTGAS